MNAQRGAEGEINKDFVIFLNWCRSKKIRASTLLPCNTKFLINTTFLPYQV